MNLPLVFDIALGLTFIYLILSLLASEIQELMTTLLQWRAEHLKKSIEVLMTGDSQDSTEAIDFVNKIYNSPLLRALNQEAKGPFATFFRMLSQRIGESYRWITRTRNMFGGQKSGPSYIPSETFAAALLEDLDIKKITHKNSRVVLQQAIDDKLSLMRAFLNTLRQQIDDETLLVVEVADLQHRIKVIQKDFASHQLSFSVAIDSIIAQFSQFIETTQVVWGDDERCQDLFRSRLPYLQQSLASQPLEPTIADVVQATLEGNNAIPQQLKDNLGSLAQEAQMQSTELVNEIQQFERSIAEWFDRAMDRSSGVYKRNAKGIAFVLGFIIAIASNTDTLYILTRLSQDSVLRSTIVETADQLVVEQGALGGDSSGQTEGEAESATAQLQEVKAAVETALADLPLPLGWTPQIVDHQKEQASDWRFPMLRRIIGWLVTGIALSMGASFWYSLIGKIIRVRNTGGATK